MTERVAERLRQVAREMCVRRFALIAALLALPALAPADSLAQTPRDQLLPLLQGIEDVPSQALLDDTISTDAGPTLRLIAADTTAPAEARLRAFVALADYPGGATLTFLAAQVTQYSQAKAGEQTLYLRAAARSLAVVGGSATVDQLASLLDHSVADVRADAALALAATGAMTALPPLRSHLLRETNDLVHLALVEAIRELTHT